MYLLTYLFKFSLGGYFSFYLILERKGEREKSLCETETLIGCLQFVLGAGIEPDSIGMCPDWGWNLQPFGVWDEAPNN